MGENEPAGTTSSRFGCGGVTSSLGPEERKGSFCQANHRTAGCGQNSVRSVGKRSIPEQISDSDVERN